jgi:putative spermidine/putrescine transport system permease protein
LFDYLRLNFTPEAAAVSSFSVLGTLLVMLASERLFGLRTKRF